MDWLPRSYFDLKSAMAPLDAIYESLWALHLVIAEISPWKLIWKAQELVRSHLDKAIWTWEKAVLQLSFTRDEEEKYKARYREVDEAEEESIMPRLVKYIKRYIIFRHGTFSWNILRYKSNLILL